jgi:hypothetical protein
MKTKPPTKTELYNQVDALTSECIRLQSIIDSKEQEEWLSEKDKAISTFYRQVPLLPRQIVNLQLDHIDKVGYWFNFELDNDSTRQTYCVRHTDLLEGIFE